MLCLSSRAFDPITMSKSSREEDNLQMGSGTRSRLCTISPTQLRKHHWCSPGNMHGLGVGHLVTCCFKLKKGRGEDVHDITRAFFSAPYPPIAAKRTASLDLHSCKVSGGNGLPRASIAAPPMSPYVKSICTFSAWPAADRTSMATFEISGPIPSPGRTAILYAEVTTAHRRLDPGTLNLCCAKRG